MSILPSLLPNYTYDDYKEWEGDWELIQGFPYAMAPKPMKIHQSMEVLFIRYFAEAFEECMECEVLAEIDWKIDERTVVAPDVVVVCNDEGEKHLITSPKIIVEILSPSTEQKDRVLKFELYEQNGVEYYILADPSKKTFEIYKLEDGKFIKDYDLDSKYRFKFDSCEKEFDFSKIFVK